MSNKSSPAWESGFEAFIAGHSDSANPYDPDAEDVAFMDWNDGYAAAQDESE